MYSATLSVPMPTAKGLEIARQALLCDRTIRATLRFLGPDGGASTGSSNSGGASTLSKGDHDGVAAGAVDVLRIELEAAQPRELRMAVHSVQEQLDVIFRTLAAFAPPPVAS